MWFCWFRRFKPALPERERKLNKRKIIPQKFCTPKLEFLIDKRHI